MARVFDRWQFSHPRTSDLDHGQGRIYEPDCLAERQEFDLGLPAECLLGF